MASLRFLICIGLLLYAGCATPRAQSNAHLPVEIQGRAGVFLFVGVDCPISNSYAPELNRIIDEYITKKVDFYLIYTDPSLSLAQAKAHSSEFGYRCPVLLDPKRNFAGRLKITVTPEVAVLSSGGDLLYLGRIDDMYAAFGNKRFAATTHELRDALDAIVRDQTVKVSRTAAIGCSIE